MISRTLIPLFLVVLPCFAQTAVYPGRVATNTDLTDLADRAQTTLNGIALNASATSFTVVTASKFSAGMILTIDNEQIKICSVVGSTVNAGNSACPNIDGRGFAGTAAASHAVGALVSNYFVSYQFKALREEIKALEANSNPTINVKGYGAVGDGSHDDTAALIAALASTTTPHVAFPPGTYKIASTISVPAGAVIEAAGGNLSNANTPPVTINFTSTSTSLFQCRKNNVVIRDLKLVQTGGTATAGSAVDILYDGSGTGLMSARFENLEIEGFYDDLIADGTYDLFLRNIQAFNAARDGFVLKGAQGTCENLLGVSNGRHGFNFGTATNNANVTCAMTGGGTYNNGGYGLNISSGFSQIANLFVNNDALGGVLVSVPGVAQVGQISNLNIQYAGVSTRTNSTTAPGIRVAALSGPVRLSNISMFSVNGNCLDLLTDNNQVFGAYMLGCGSTAQAGNVYSVNIAGVSNMLEGVKANGPIKIAGNYNVLTGNDLSNGGTTPTVEFASGVDQTFVGNRIFGGTTSMLIDAGVTITSAGNTLIGAVTNNGFLAVDAVKLMPDVLYSATFTQLSTVNPNNRPMLVFCSNCTASSVPCTGGGGGASAQYKPGYNWVCGQ